MDITKAIVDELTLSYAACGRTPSMALGAVAESMQKALGFSSSDHVHKVFQKARFIENIPTQRTLADCMRNYSEEVLKYTTNETSGAIEYENPVRNWMPDSEVNRRVNVTTAIKNYCMAVGEKSYSEYCKIHLTDTNEAGGRKVVKWKFPEKVRAFDEPIREYLKYLFSRYLRMTPQYKGFPARSTPELGMIPPSVREIRIMLAEEAKINNNA